MPGLNAVLLFSGVQIENRSLFLGGLDPIFTGASSKEIRVSTPIAPVNDQLCCSRAPVLLLFSAAAPKMQ